MIVKHAMATSSALTQNDIIHYFNNVLKPLSRASDKRVENTESQAFYLKFPMNPVSFLIYYKQPERQASRTRRN